MDAEGKVQTEALEAEKKNTMELRAQVERVRSEAAMAEEKLKANISDLEQSLERAKENARIRELQVKREQSVRHRFVLFCTTPHSLAELII